MTVRRITGLTAGLAAAASAAAIGLAAPAFAASNHGISGTPYSGCTNHTWYYSSTARYKAGYGAVKVEFSQIGKNGLNFKIIDAHNATIGHSVTFSYTETDWWQTMATGVSDGKKFFNAFEEASTSCFTNDHDFVGTEYY
jgi:hypothetical protein